MPPLPRRTISALLLIAATLFPLAALSLSCQTSHAQTTNPTPKKAAAASQPATAPAPVTQPAPASQPVGVSIYVHENGDDVNGDGSMARPFRTMKKAQNKLRIATVNGRKTLIDKMRLHAGGEFDNPSWALIGWNNVDCPDIDVYTLAGEKLAKANVTSDAGNGLTFLHCDKVKVRNLNLIADHRNPTDAPNLKITVDGSPLQASRQNGYSPGDGVYLDSCNDYDLEGVSVQFFQDGFTFLGDHCRAGLVLNCEAYDCYSTNAGFSQGFFAQGQLNLVLDHPVAVRCGWCRDIAQAPASQFNHGTYLKKLGGQQNVQIIEPVMIDCSSSGITADCGAVVIGGYSDNNGHAANAPNIWVGDMHGEIHGHVSLNGAVLMLSKTGEVEGCIVSPKVNPDGTTLQPMEIGQHRPDTARGPGDIVKVHDNRVIGWDGPPVTIRPNQGGAGVQTYGNSCVLSQSLAKRWLSE